MRAGAEVIEIPIGLGRVVVVVAGRRIRAIPEPAPGRVVRGSVVAKGSVVVLVVAERQDGPRSDPADQAGGPPMTQAGSIGTCDISRRNDHRVSQRRWDTGRRKRGSRQGDDGCQTVTGTWSSVASHRLPRLPQPRSRVDRAPFPAFGLELVPDRMGLLG
jgi:hypothetical protein